MRGGTFAVHNRVPVFLCTLLVLVPPHAQGGCVVTADGGHTAARVVLHAAEAHPRLLRHRLQLEAEDSQFVHHPLHAGRHHAEIFGTAEHTGGTHQFRQLLHGFLIPELVVAVVEILVIEGVEGALLVLRELLESLRLLG